MSTYKRHRFPPAIISYAVWIYYRFNLSYRDVEDLLAERGVIVSREAIRHWYSKHSLRSWGRLYIKFGKIYTRRLNKAHKGFGDTLFLDEVFVKINDKQHYLWRAVDQESLPMSAASAYC
jgi:putative transposase